MLLRTLILLAIILTSPCLLPAQALPIGHWRDHLPYHHATKILASGNNIWCATPHSVFSVDVEENSFERWSKVNGLSETGVSAIGLDANFHQLIIAYHSGNIDVLKGHDVININAIKNAAIAGDKSIRHIFTAGSLAYLSTGLGIIVLNLEKREVKDTYIIGAQGNKTGVNRIASDNNLLYAATDEGLKKAAVGHPHLADFRNWELLSGVNGLPAGASQAVVVVQQQLIALHHDTLYILKGSSWQSFYAAGYTIHDISVSQENILVSESLTGTGRVVQLNINGTVEKIIQHNTQTTAPRQAIFFQDHYWIADSMAGLTKTTGNTFESYIPNSPGTITTGPLLAANDKLWASATQVNTQWQPAGNTAGVYHLAEGQWARIHTPDSLPDIMALTTDPKDGSLWAGSYGGGLINITASGQQTVYKQQSPLQPAYFDPGSYRVSGLAFDASNNLWIANYGASSNIHAKSFNGSWYSFAIPFPLAENAASQLLPDDVNQLWIIAPKSNGLICFNYGQQIDNTGDDRWKWYRAGKNNGNLPDNDVRCMAKDKQGVLWIGTARGIATIACAPEVFTVKGCEAVLPIVQQDNFAGYLFSDEIVQSIAIDGANRKWIGTRNGVWLLNPDGEKIIYRFTESNSPLLSNDVRQIAINGKTGEVFFATANGLCSYSSTATDGATEHSNVKVFPNPVPPGYTGTIAIRGLANNSIVKITELDGRLVHQTKALGGQAIWNGRQYNGGAVSTGVYLVLVSDETRKETLATKIVFIKK